MDAFCGFVKRYSRKIRGARCFFRRNAGCFQPIFNHLLGVQQILPKQPGYIRIKPVFLSGQKPQREAPGR